MNTHHKSYSGRIYNEKKIELLKVNLDIYLEWEPTSSPLAQWIYQQVKEDRVIATHYVISINHSTLPRYQCLRKFAFQNPSSSCPESRSEYTSRLFYSRWHDYERKGICSDVLATHTYYTTTCVITISEYESLCSWTHSRDNW